MSEHLTLWNEFADIDPKFTKAITGKAYKGTSPNPQYVIRCLTELFGPVGMGFGWRVLAEEFVPLGTETLHWCRIEFWHTDRANTFEAYGQTKAAYQTSGGKFIVDEDAPKKSLTDAIIKAASQIGIAANIFLGRWDDQKYVQEVNAEYRKEERADKAPPKEPVESAEQKPGPDAVKAGSGKDAPPNDATPKFDAKAAEARIIAAIAKKTTEEALSELWRQEVEVVREIGDEGKDRILDAFKARKAQLTQKDAA